MSCKAKCRTGALNTDKGKAEIRVKCKDPPVLELKWFDEDDELKCEASRPDECVQAEIDLEIVKGRLDLVSYSSKKGRKYNLVCDDGSIPGWVKCKDGEFTSKLDDFESACDKYICDERDAYDQFPIGGGMWECKSKKGKLFCNGICGVSPRADS